MALTPYHGRDPIEEARERAKSTNDFVTGVNRAIPGTYHGGKDSEKIREVGKTGISDSAKDRAAQVQRFVAETNAPSEAKDSRIVTDKEVDAEWEAFDKESRAAEKTKEHVDYKKAEYFRRSLPEGSKEQAEAESKNDALLKKDKATPESKAWEKATDVLDELRAKQKAQKNAQKPKPEDAPPKDAIAAPPVAAPVPGPAPAAQPPPPEDAPAAPQKVDDSDRPQKPATGVSEDRRINGRIDDVEDILASQGALNDPQRPKNNGREEIAGDGGGIDYDYCYIGTKKVIVPTKTSNFLKIYLDGATPEWVAAMPETQGADSVVFDVTKNRIYLTGNYA